MRKDQIAPNHRTGEVKKTSLGQERWNFLAVKELMLTLRQWSKVQSGVSLAVFWLMDRAVCVQSKEKQV